LTFSQLYVAAVTAQLLSLSAHHSVKLDVKINLGARPVVLRRVTRYFVEENMDSIVIERDVLLTLGLDPLALMEADS
jgi:hypothetical protein